MTKEAAQALVQALNSVFPASQMAPGTRFELTLDKQQDFYGRDVIFPVQLSFRPGPQETIIVEADEDGTFTARVDGEKEGTLSRYAQVDHFRTKSRVGSSLYGTAKDNKVPGYIISELTRVFAYDVDFQRQVRASDSFEVFLRQPAHRVLDQAQGAPLRAAYPCRKDQDLVPLHHQGRRHRLL